MKKVINGKMYNTETATLIAEWDNGYYNNDFHRCDETLYKTKRNSIFCMARAAHYPLIQCLVEEMNQLAEKTLF